MTTQIGYSETRSETIHRKLCYLTVGSIIKFNGEKCIVTSVYPISGRKYKDINGKYVELSLGYNGFLKNINTGVELRSNWHNVIKENIIHFEHLDLIKNEL